MIPTPGPPYQRDGLGAVNDHTGETVGLVRRRQRRREVAERLQAVVDRHPTGTIDIAWENAATHGEDAVAAVVRAAAGRLGRLDLPTDSPWLNPIERRWRQCRREVTPCQLLAALDALL